MYYMIQILKNYVQNTFEYIVETLLSIVLQRLCVLFVFTLWVAFVHLQCSPNHLICDDIIVVFVSGAPILCDDIIVRQWVNKCLFIIVIVQWSPNYL